MMQKKLTDEKSISVDHAIDIKWLENSKPLMLSPDSCQLFKPPKVSELPRMQSDYPAPPAYRLGKQFEDTLEQLINLSKNKTLLVRNFAIRQDNRTLGELDMIYSDSDSVIHLEAAIKFYLYQPDQWSLSSFIGPGGKDRLDKKYLRLCDHQLPMLYRDATREALKEKGILVPDKQELLLTGVLFYPLGMSHPSPDEFESISINPEHLKGWWLHRKQLKNLKQHFPSVSFVVLPRWHWIGGIAHYSVLNPMTFEELEARTPETNGPLMISVVQRKESEVNWVEISRGFIVQDQWPDREDYLSKE